MPDDDTSYSDTNEITTNSNTRWTYIGTVSAAIMLISLAVIVTATAAGLFTVAPITQGWFILYSTVTLMAATWAFGEETLKAVRRAKNGSPSKERKE